MRPTLAALGLATAMAAVPAVAGAQSGMATTAHYMVMLSGKVEQPARGAPHGTGTAIITLNLAKHTVCYSFNVHGIKLPAEAAHIHAGKAGKAGPVVVPLTPPLKNGKAKGCIHKVSTSLIKGMISHPKSYYVNVHTSNYPGGAVRGQL